MFAFCETSVACAPARTLSTPVPPATCAAAAPGGIVCKDKDGGEVEVEDEEDNDEDRSKGSKDDWNEDKRLGRGADTRLSKEEVQSDKETQEVISVSMGG